MQAGGWRTVLINEVTLKKKKGKIIIILFQMLTWQYIIDQFQVFKERNVH